MRTMPMALFAMSLLATSALAQDTGSGSGAQAAQRQPAANNPRTIEGINTVWLEELTQPEFRDMIVRFAQRVKAGQAEINGITFESLAWVQELGRNVAELRVATTVNAIQAFRATARLTRVGGVH